MSDTCQECAYITISVAGSGDPMQPPPPGGQPGYVYICSRFPERLSVPPNYRCHEYTAPGADSVSVILSDILDKLDDLKEKVDEIKETLDAM